MNYLKVNLLIAGISLISCTENATNSDNLNLTENISGTYVGSLIDNNQNNIEYNAEVEISQLSETSIDMVLHCEIMDTTISFDVYRNDDSIMVCLEGEDFEECYGHSKSGHHHMMDDDDKWDWMHHLNEDHDPGDKHYGSFDNDKHTFTYRFTNEQNTAIEYVFEGIKQ